MKKQALTQDLYFSPIEVSGQKLRLIQSMQSHLFGVTFEGVLVVACWEVIKEPTND